MCGCSEPFRSQVQSHFCPSFLDPPELQLFPLTEPRGLTRPCGQRPLHFKKTLRLQRGDSMPPKSHSQRQGVGNHRSTCVLNPSSKASAWGGHTHREGL